MTSDTEQQIIDAARKIFMKKGLTGARMQEIADEAGINKALLHYYYRSKEKLFNKVFDEMLFKFLPGTINKLSEESSFEEAIRSFVDTYLSILKQTPELPVFILNELQNNPDRLPKLLLSNTGKLKKDPRKVFIRKINKAIENKEIREIDPKELLVNILSLCVFPFAGKHMIQTVIFSSKKGYKDFIQERSKQVSDFIINSIKL